MGMNIVILGNLSGIGGEIANQLARLGHEAYAMPGVVAVEILAGLRPQLLIPVATETGMTTETVSRLVAETGAAVIVVASPGSPWATWGEHLQYPVIAPERAAGEIAARLSELMAQVQATEQARYLQTVYGAPVVVASQPRVIGFGGPKGGTGKSTVAANAAALLAARGALRPPHRCRIGYAGEPARFIPAGRGNPYLFHHRAGQPPPAHAPRRRRVRTRRPYPDLLEPGAGPAGDPLEPAPHRRVVDPGSLDGGTFPFRSGSGGGLAGFRH